MELIPTVETVVPVVILIACALAALLRLASATIGLATSVVKLIQTLRDGSRKE